MSYRHRSVRGSATPASSRSNNTSQAPSQASGRPRAVPQYSQPSAPLNEKAMSDLQRLPAESRRNVKLAELQKEAISFLTESAFAANDAAADQKKLQNKLQERVRKLAQTQGSQGQQDRERSAAAAENEGEEGGFEDRLQRARRELESHQAYWPGLQRRVEEATSQAEEKLRSLIDQKTQVAARAQALAEVSANVVRGSGRVAPTQSTLGASQFRSQRDPEDDEEDEDGSGEEHSVLIAVKRKLDEQYDDYSKLTMRARYGRDNDYIGFKKGVHDALHAEDGAKMPHESQWFPGEAGHGADGIQGGNAQDEEDSDIEIARVVLSTRCPITLMELKDPLTSPCGHNFEAAAIREMIAHSNERDGESQRGPRRGAALGAKVIRCPDPHCNARFTEKDLKVDAAMRRKIQRTQAARQEEEEDDEDSGRARAVLLDEDEDSRLDGPDTAAPVMVKPEPRSSMRMPSAVPSTPRPSVSGIHVDDPMDEDDQGD